jgi:hypothetical protein
MENYFITLIGNTEIKFDVRVGAVVFAFVKIDFQWNKKTDVEVFVYSKSS